MHIEDQFVVPAPVALVWQAITDPSLVASCVPGCETVEILSPTAYRATVKIEIGPIKARFNLTVEVKEQIPCADTKSVTCGEEDTKASIVAAENIVQLAATQGWQHRNSVGVRGDDRWALGKIRVWHYAEKGQSPRRRLRQSLPRQIGGTVQSAG